MFSVEAFAVADVVAPVVAAVVDFAVVAAAAAAAAVPDFGVGALWREVVPSASGWTPQCCSELEQEEVGVGWKIEVAAWAALAEAVAVVVARTKKVN